MIPLARPDLTYDEVAGDLEAVIASGMLTTGPYLERFERELAEAVGVAHAVATSSATTALHLGLVAAGIGAGDEVLVSDFTFPATGNVIIQLGAVPVMVDCRPGSFALDHDDLAAKCTERTTAILAVDPFGQPAPLPELTSLASTRGLFVLEDAACALGTTVDGRQCGSWPGAGCFSFHPRKVITTGEGGALTTDDGVLAARARRLRSHGGAPSGGTGLRFVENGFNYRMAELPAALGVRQLSKLDQILADRRTTAERYGELLAGIEGVTVPEERPGTRWTFQSYVILLDDGIDRDAIVVTLRAAGIETTLGTYAMHAHPAFEQFGHRPGDLPHSYRNQQQSLTLPLLPRMEESVTVQVTDSLAAAVAEHRGGRRS